MIDQISQMPTTLRLLVVGMGNVNKPLLGVAPVKNVMILNLLLVIFYVHYFFNIKFNVMSTKIIFQKDSSNELNINLFWL